MTNENEIKIMSMTVKSIKDILEKRMSQRMDTLETLASSSMDNIPESIQKMREAEASKTRAVIQEQRDILELIKSLFP